MASYSVQARARAMLELRQRRAIAASVAEAGGGAPIGPDVTFLEWVQTLGEQGLKVDGQPFRLDNRPALRDIYAAIPASKAEGYNKIFAIIKGAQTGATVMTFLMQIYLCLKYAPIKVGTYYPDAKLAAYVSSSRFMPVVRSVPIAYAELKRVNGGGEGNVMTRTLGDSEVLFLYTSGSSITESFPLGAVVADEVQNMSDDDLNRVRERMSASDVRFFFACSTAKGTGTDIDALYQRGNQHRFHTQCRCDDGVILDEVFPECIEQNVGQYDDQGAPRDWVYACPHCHTYIPDSQRGRWVQHNPESANISYHLPQTLSPTVSPAEVMEAYLTATDLTSFFQRKLGKPYNDPAQVPINMDVLNKAAELGRRMGVQWKTSARDTFMGLDQMGGFVVAVILEKLPSGHQALVHAEFIYREGNETWDRASELMREYGVQTCVVEQLPNFDNARAFANKHPGRVFLATYGGSSGDMVVWSDQTNRSEKRTIEEDRSRFMVGLDQYKAMQTAMKRVVNGITVFPDPNGLIAPIKTKGIRKPMPVLRECWKHFMKIELAVERDPEQRKIKTFVKKIGTDDPHAAYAFMLANVAWARAWGTGTIIMPSPDKVAEAAPPIQALVEQNGAKRLPGHVAEALMQASAIMPPPGTCTSCRFFNSGISYCGQRGFGTEPAAPSCDEYQRKENQ